MSKELITFVLKTDSDFIHSEAKHTIMFHFVITMSTSIQLALKAIAVRTFTIDFSIHQQGSHVLRILAVLLEISLMSVPSCLYKSWNMAS